MSSETSTVAGEPSGAAPQPKPPPASSRPPLVATLGGGGAYALGFHLGIAQGMREEGIDLATVPLMGTSGGSHAAVAIASGMTFDEVVAIWQPYVDSVGSIWVDALALTEMLYGHAELSPGLAAAGVAVRLRWFKREVLWAADHRPAEIVAASSSPFPFVRPTKVGKRRYIDGGHRSGTSCDLALDADLQLVLAPFALKSQGFIGRMGARQIAKEPAKWSARTGGQTMVIGPDDAMCAVVVKNMRAMGDTSLGRRIYELAIPLGRRTAELLRRDHADVSARLAA
jgi:predicted acylesterase/phospholipase RssA